MNGAIIEEEIGKSLFEFSFRDSVDDLELETFDNDKRDPILSEMILEFEVFDNDKRDSTLSKMTLILKFDKKINAQSKLFKKQLIVEDL